MSKSSLTQPFTPLFAYDMALCFDPPEAVCAKHGVSPEEYERIRDREDFKAAVERYHKAQREEGKLAAVMAGAVLDDIAVRRLRDIIMDSDTPPDTVNKSLELLNKLAGRDKAAPPLEGGGFMLQMNFNDVRQPVGAGKAVATVMPAFVESTPEPN
jgi:hypothetical protein